MSNKKTTEADGFDSGKISMCCSGKRNMHHGYKWRKDK